MYSELTALPFLFLTVPKLFHIHEKHRETFYFTFLRMHLMMWSGNGTQNVGIFANSNTGSMLDSRLYIIGNTLVF